MNTFESLRRHVAARDNRMKSASAGGTRPAGTRHKWRPYRPIAAVILLASVGVGAFWGRAWWLPRIQRLAAVERSDVSRPTAEHDHSAHPDREPSGAVRLSEQAKKNIGLELTRIEPRDFNRTVTIPAMIVARPGRTDIRVSAPMTGIITRIHLIRGEAVAPGQPLFDLRLTHEDLVQLQSRFLRTVEQLDVIEQEVARLDKVTASGAVAGKRLLERKYEQQMAKALLHSQRQALILHGLSESQVDGIASRRKLLREVTVLAPAATGEQPGRLLQVTALETETGQHLTAGEQLCTLTDNSELYIEGKAFEEDAESLNKAAQLGTPITALVQGNGKGPHEVGDLKILYVAGHVEPESRALRFYVKLPNQLLRDQLDADKHRFIAWRYRPGQRVELLVPVESWTNKVVLPVDAVVTEGAESFVFRQKGGRFDRRPVHVEYSDQRWVVIENDGTLFPGDLVAAAGAYQIHLALKNKAGGGVDPHAGHNH